MKYTYCVILALGLVFTPLTNAETADELPAQTLITNVYVWDGTSNKRTEKISVLIEDNLIKKVDAMKSDAHIEANIIDGAGKTLIPGMHDQHVHFSIFSPLEHGLRTDMTQFDIGAMGVLRAERMLMNGFTTVRDVGGPSKYLQKIIDAGLAPGPRVYPSGAMITQTSGHGDFRNRNDPHPNMYGGTSNNNWVDTEISFIADSPTEVRRAVRENLKRGVTQIKIMTSGGVVSDTSVLHSLQYTDEEIRAAVVAAQQWNTYVAAHAHTIGAMHNAIDNGVETLEHVAFLNKDVGKKMLTNDVMFATSLTRVFSVSTEDARKHFSKRAFQKFLKLREGARGMVKTVQDNPEMLKLWTIGSDFVNDWGKAIEQDKAMNLEFGNLREYFDDVDVLRIATSNGARMNMKTGQLNPYQDGPLGVIVNGAYADLLLVEGNPVDDVTVLGDPDTNLKLIMKDGKVFKNTL